MKKMKKTVLIFAAALITSAAQATILRVSNVVNSGAPYTTIGDAIYAAEEGDTVMVDGSATKYSSSATIEVSKKIVLMGPGYWRSENGIIQEGVHDATIGNIRVSVDDGATITGLVIDGNVSIQVSHVTITRCKITGDIGHGMPSNGVSNTVIHQCYLQGMIEGYANNNYNTGLQITNNILTRRAVNSGGSVTGVIRYIADSYIAFNTFVGSTYSIDDYHIMNVSGCTIEKNFIPRVGSISGCSYIDNIETTVISNPATDLAVKTATEQEANVTPAYGITGAFAGDDPYVISGLPSGPVVEDITVPASVAMGSKLNVTIKLGVTK